MSRRSYKKKENEEDDVWGTNKYDVLEVVKIGNLPTPREKKKKEIILEDRDLKNKWILWAHDINNNDWSTTSYKRLHEIKTYSDFWKLFNNFGKLGIRYSHYFLMKDGIKPIWEDEQNRDGGILSVRIEMDSALSLLEDLGTRMVIEEITDEQNDINGISISPKHNWALIKLWNKNSKNDLSVNMKQEILDRYSHLSVKYKLNQPEY